MDKLQPIIRNKFWIFAVIAILAPIYPWMSTISEMKAAYTTKEGEIKSAFSSIPKDQSPPNSNWKKPVDEATSQQTARYVETQDMLWKMQKPLLVWPDEIKAEIVNNAVPFWGEFPTSALRTYKNRYGVYKYQLWKNVLRGFTPKAQGPITPVTTPGGDKPETGKAKPGEEIVAFPFTDLPLPELDKSQVDLSSKEVWEVQEDLWLLESLFKSIAKVNRQQPIPAQSQMNAVIKQIYKIELMGGAKSRLNPGNPGSLSVGPPFTLNKSVGPQAGVGVPINPYGASVQPAGDIVSFSFSASEEFGAGTVSKAPNSSLTGTGPIVVPQDGASSKSKTPPAPPPAPGGKITADPKRYVDNKTNELNLRTRGFYIELLMDNDKIPQLLTEMRNSPWPTRIYRIQMVAKENATSPTVNYATPAGAPAVPNVAAGGGGGGGFGRGRRRDEDDFVPAAPVNPKPVVDVGPLSSPKLSYVAIAGLITIYLPPNEASEKTAFLPDGTDPAAPASNESANAPATGSQNAPSGANPTATPPSVPETPASPPAPSANPNPTTAPETPPASQ